MALQITVHTPTWNRSATLKRVWQSLMHQESCEFEWIVSDDHSEDETIALVERWQSESPFDIRIRSFPRRSGKPTLDNDAVLAARGEYFVQIGSDDEFLPGALARFIQIWEEIPSNLRDEYCIVNAQSQRPDGTAIGRPFETSPFDTTPFDLTYLHDMHFDSWNCYRTQVMREFPYPEVDFIVPESVVWVHGIRRTYRMRCARDPVVIVHGDGRYATSGSRRMRYNGGYAYGLAAALNNPLVAELQTERARLRRIVNYARLSRHAGTAFKEARRKLVRARDRSAFTALYPAACAVAISDVAQRKVEQTPFHHFDGNPTPIEPRQKRIGL